MELGIDGSCKSWEVMVKIEEVVYDGSVCTVPGYQGGAEDIYVLAYLSQEAQVSHVGVINQLNRGAAISIKNQAHHILLGILPTIDGSATRKQGEHAQENWLSVLSHTRADDPS